MQSWLSRGPTARIVSGFHCVRFDSRKPLFEEGVFNSFACGAGPASAKVEQWLCSWKSQMDQME